MKICLVIFLCVLLFFILLAYPIKAVAKIHINLVDLKAFYSIKVLFVKLLCGTTYIEDNQLIIQNTHNLFPPMKEPKKQLLIIENILKRISIDTCHLYFCGGIKDNAYQTAMVCGYIQAITVALFCVLITKNNCINIFQDIDPQYNKDALDVTVKCVIEISILDVLAALIVSLFSYKEKYGDKSE